MPQSKASRSLSPRTTRTLRKNRMLLTLRPSQHAADGLRTLAFGADQDRLWWMPGALLLEAAGASPRALVAVSGRATTWPAHALGLAWKGKQPRGTFPSLGI